MSRNWWPWIVVLVVLIIAGSPSSFSRSRMYGGPVITVTWKFGHKKNFRLIFQSNKYFTGAGINLPGSKRSECDYAISIDDNSINRQYPNGRSVGMKAMIRF